MRHGKPLRSLKSKALQLLAQREQSRLELRRKLMAHAVALDLASADGPGMPGVEGGDTPPSADEPATAAHRVDEVLAWLDAHRFQSDARFAESRINARADRYGDLRIRLELKQHGVALDAEKSKVLGETEFARAWTLWERRFGDAAFAAASPTKGTPNGTTDGTANEAANAAAKQSRFLSARGFSPEVVRKVLKRARSIRPETEASADEN